MKRKQGRFEAYRHMQESGLASPAADTLACMGRRTRGGVRLEGSGHSRTPPPQVMDLWIQGLHRGKGLGVEVVRPRSKSNIASSQFCVGLLLKVGSLWLQGLCQPAPDLRF